MDASDARRLWLVGEPIHALTYFAQPAFDAWEAAGITGFWRGYFATRAAPFGAVGPGPVVAALLQLRARDGGQGPPLRVGPRVSGGRPAGPPRRHGRRAARRRR